MLGDRGIEGIGIYVARANSPRFDGTPAVASALLVGLEDKIAFVSGVEVPHLWELLLHLLEVMKDCLATPGQLHFGAEVHAYVVVVSKSLIGTHGLHLTSRFSLQNEGSFRPSTPPRSSIK